MTAEYSETNSVGSPSGWRLPPVRTTMSKLAMTRPKFAPGGTTGRPIQDERRAPRRPAPASPPVARPRESRHGPAVARRVQVADAPPRPQEEDVPVRGLPEHAPAR